eukprot:scaffold12559_cov125-Isochrysis_galbana.AAC.3
MKKGKLLEQEVFKRQVQVQVATGGSGSSWEKAFRFWRRIKGIRGRGKVFSNFLTKDQTWSTATPAAPDRWATQDVTGRFRTTKNLRG